MSNSTQMTQAVAAQRQRPSDPQAEEGSPVDAERVTWQVAENLPGFSPSHDVHTEKASQSYALFQQALVERSPQAWEKLYTTYLPLVLRWVRQEPAFALSEEEAQDIANRAFTKLWHSLTPEKFANFASTAALLQYLHLCVRSVVVDQSRYTQRRSLEIDALPAEQQGSEDVAEGFYATLQRDEFWQQVQTCLKSEKERQLLYYRFVLNIKPNRICEEYQEIFASPTEVYSLSQNILARLRRDPGLQKFLHLHFN